LHPVAGCRRLSIVETLKICLTQTRLQGCEVGEVYVLGLSVLPGTVIYTSRLAAAPISLECRFHSVTPFGDTGAEFFVGGVVMFHIRDGLLQGGKIDTALLPPICRIGGPNYASLGSIVTKRGIQQTPKSIIKPEAA
jgi:flavin reductase (DIM6/NTAB) family NADH-FMN oxidoreductase RutF